MAASGCTPCKTGKNRTVGAACWAEAVAGGATIMYSNRMNIRPKLSCFHALVHILRSPTKFRSEWATLIIFHFCTAQRYRTAVQLYSVISILVSRRPRRPPADPQQPFLLSGMCLASQISDLCSKKLPGGARLTKHVMLYRRTAVPVRLYEP